MLHLNGKFQCNAMIMVATNWIDPGSGSGLDPMIGYPHCGQIQHPFIQKTKPKRTLSEKPPFSTFVKKKFWFNHNHRNTKALEDTMPSVAGQPRLLNGGDVCRRLVLFFIWISSFLQVAYGTIHIRVVKKEKYFAGVPHSAWLSVPLREQAKPVLAGSMLWWHHVNNFMVLLQANLMMESIQSSIGATTLAKVGISLFSPVSGGHLVLRVSRMCDCEGHSRHQL